MNVLIVEDHIDPERDTPAVLADYVAASDPRIVGLTGSPEQVAVFAKAYKVYYSLSCPTENPADRAKLKAPDDCPDSYLVDHTSAVYLMDPKGRFTNAVAHQLGPDQAADVIRREMEKQGD